MKQKVFAFALALATIMVLLLPLTPPHHHHNGTVCNILEHCDKDHATNDIHTHHHGDSSTCVEEAEYIAPRVGTQRTFLTPVQIKPFMNTLPVFIMAVLYTCTLRTPRYGRTYISHYVSPQHPVFALRAPPPVAV
jgi:hypothetical protein